MAKHKTSIMFSLTAKKLIVRLVEKLGLSQSAIIELAIRKLAESENVSVGEE